MDEKDAKDLLGAARVLTDQAVEDFIYSIRERVPPEWEGSTWDHPTVVAWASACATMKILLKKYGV